MDYSYHTLSHLVVQHCLSAGVETVVISPGSRNAPLVMDFQAYAGFKCYSIVDERSAGFFALGIAQQSGRAVALVCTSGSALVNYFPAVTEAYYSQLPLIVISADRPEELIDRGEGQTIKQKNIFGGHVLGQTNLSNQDSNLNSASESLGKTIGKAFAGRGPVHINVPMDEPLYEKSHRPMDFGTMIAKHLVMPSPSLLDESYVADRIKQYHATPKKMIMIGAMAPGRVNADLMEIWQSDPSVIVLTETLANAHHPEFISGIDQTITHMTEEQQVDLKPDLLITMGGMIVSKRIKKLLRAMEIQEHWHLGPERPNDTFFALKHHLDAAPNDFFMKLAQTDPIEESESSFKQDWLDLRERRMSGHWDFLSQSSFCDLKVHEALALALPNNIQLQIANSASIRYAQLFPANATHEIFCNRGTSGIEGSTSTAVGAAVANPKPTVLITGDLSFFYDINALWQNHTPNNFRIILINNQGGGIFRILPKAKSIKPFETYLETPHQRNAVLMAKEFDFNYLSAHDQSSLTEALDAFFSTQDAGPQILEIFTPKQDNDLILNQYFDHLDQMAAPHLVTDKSNQ